MGDGISITIEAAGLDDAIARIGRLETFDAGDMMSAIGAVGESQTRRRISDEKTAPDGSPWAPNRRGGSILVESGQHLLQSIAFTSSVDEATWGASWEHAHVHQEGMTIVPKSAPVLAFDIGGQMVFARKVTIPARPFVGLSEENGEEILELVTDVFGALLR